MFSRLKTLRLFLALLIGAQPCLAVASPVVGLGGRKEAAFVSNAGPLMSAASQRQALRQSAPAAPLPLQYSAVRRQVMKAAAVRHPAATAALATNPAPQIQEDRDLPIAEAGVTALSGRVLSVDGEPLAGVALSDGEMRTHTDLHGRFLLRNIRPGRSVLIIDGRNVPATADAPTDYGYYEARIDAAEGKTNQLGYTSWLTPIDHRYEVTIASPTKEEVRVTTPLVPGLELRIPAGAVITDPDGKPVTKVGITPIRVDRTPFALPRNVTVPIYFTAQPGGARISSLDGAWIGAQVVYPNYSKELEGARGTFWKYDPDGLGWETYGTGTVNADASQVVPDPGTRIYALTGAMFRFGQTPPTKGPRTGGSKGGDPVDLSSGLFVHTETDLALPDVLPIAVTRTYRPGDTNQRTFGVGTTLPYDMFLWSANPFQECDLVLPTGSKVHYTRVIDPANPTSNDYIDAKFISTAPGEFYQSTIVWNTDIVGWDLIRKDGTRLQFGIDSPLQSITDRFGNKITITRVGGSGPISQVSSPHGRYIKFTQDAGNRITSATDNLGRKFVYGYDASGRLTSVTDPNQGVSTYNWNTNNQLTSIVDPRKTTVVSNVYDTADRVVTQTVPSGVYRFAYAPATGVTTETTVTDPANNIRKVGFNTQGFTISEKLAYGTAIEQDYTWTRDAATGGFVQTATDPLNRVTSFAYDAAGNTTAVTELSGTASAVTTRFTYDKFNNLLTVTDPLGHTSTITRDKLGRVLAIADPLGHGPAFSYVFGNQPTSVTTSLGFKTNLIYDQGDLVGVTDPLGRTRTRYTDSGGRTLRLTDPLKAQAALAHDPLYGLSKFTNQTGAAASLTYDPNGNLTKVTNPRGAATSYTYNARNLVTVRTDPAAATDQVTSYNGNDQALTFVNRKGQTTTRTYDALGRLWTVTYADGGKVTYTYDAGNRVTSQVDTVGGTINRVYDLLDRLTSETTAQGSVSYTYDADSRRTGMTVSGQAPVTYAYDIADRLTGITQGTTTTSFTYDNDNRRTGMTLPSGASAAYAYDNSGALTSLTWSQGATSLGTLTYTYDGAGRLSGRGGTLFTSALPTSSTAVYDISDRMTSRTSGGVTVTPVWDKAGNLTSDGSRTYSWDARGRLTGISGVATYLYDAEGRRIKTTPTTGSAASVVYDDVDVVQEQLAGVASANLLNGPGIDEHLTRATLGTGAATSTLLTDALGSIVALASSAGTVATRYGYTPYGAAGVTGAANTNPYQFTGAPQDGSGLIYLRARYYNPVWGRFISEDPIGLAGGINRYAYADGNPAEIIDPFGLDGVRRHGETALGKAGDFLEDFSGDTGTLGLGLAGAGIVTAWTGVGFAGFEGAAGISETVSGVTGGAALVLKAADGAWDEVASGVLAIAVNRKLSKALDGAIEKAVEHGTITKIQSKLYDLGGKIDERINETLLSPKKEKRKAE